MNKPFGIAISRTTDWAAMQKHCFAPRTAHDPGNYNPIEHHVSLQAHAAPWDKVMLVLAGVFMGWISFAPFVNYLKGLL